MNISTKHTWQHLGPVIRWAIMLCLLVTTAAAARAAGDDLLSNDRWESRGEGLSLRPPLGSQTLQLTGDDAILRIAHPAGYKINVYVKQSTRDLTLDEVVAAAVHQAATTPTTVRKVQDPTDVKLGTLSGRIFSFAAPDVTPPAVLVQAFAMLSPRKVLIVELDSHPDIYEKVRPAFDQMITSVEFEDPKALFKERESQLEAGQTWLKTLTPEKIHQKLVAEQWFRLTDQKHETGYMRVNQHVDKTLERPGVRVDMQMRLILNGVAYDTLSNYFASDETSEKTRNEVWSVRTTTRPQAGAGKDAREQSWAETGLLSKGVLSLTRQSPQEKKPYEWKQLPPGYVPQAYVQILPSLLSPANKQVMAFYAYYGNTGKIALRTERVEATSDGSYKVFSRPSPEQQEQVSWYDASGKLIRRVLPGGQVLLPATATEINTRWKVKP